MKTPITQAIEKLHTEIRCCNSQIRLSDENADVLGDMEQQEAAFEVAIKYPQSLLPTERKVIESAWLDGSNGATGIINNASQYYNETFKSEIDMRITFVLEDTWQFQMSGIRSTKKRTVTIELTESQLKQIDLRCVGTNAGKNMFEEITDLYIGNS
jgi:hypothetical protein